MLRYLDGSLASSGTTTTTTTGGGGGGSQQGGETVDLTGYARLIDVSYGVLVAEHYTNNTSAALRSDLVSLIDDAETSANNYTDLKISELDFSSYALRGEWSGDVDLLEQQFVQQLADKSAADRAYTDAAAAVITALIPAPTDLSSHTTVSDVNSSIATVLQTINGLVDAEYTASRAYTDQQITTRIAAQDFSAYYTKTEASAPGISHELYQSPV